MKNTKTLLLIIFFLVISLVTIIIKEKYPQKLIDKLSIPNAIVASKLYLKTDEYRHELGLYNIYKKKGNIVMLGNSITYRVNWNELLNREDVINRGIGRDITQGFIDRLQTVKDVEPKLCFVMGGINDIVKGVETENIVKNIDSISKSLKANGIIPIVHSVLYVSDDYPDFEKINSKVKKTNNLIKQFCTKNAVEYIDLNYYFSENNILKKKYSFDGIHLTAVAYKKWGELLSTVINRNI